MANRQLRPLSAEVGEKIYSVVQENAVLVGGQSLAFWVSKYQIPVNEQMGAISMDVDYLGDKAVASTIADHFLMSTVTFPEPYAITALVGNVHIIPDDFSYMNVDVIHKIVGLRADAVRERAVQVILSGEVLAYIRVMHPMHVLKSRMLNFYWLPEKRTPNGVMQMRLAIKAAYHYILDVAQNMPSGGQRAARRMIEEVIDLAKSAPGRVAKLNGIDFRDAIPFNAITSPLFHSERMHRIHAELDKAKPPANWIPISPT
ncbi:hypothetical protein [uncultured Massilia sp.]|uniref:hypothetical protein n=1 Tax=uncultured Massilia sp. TaxID=169973 RepID=UPI0025F371F4|nr:hypothetical protein [uncultured Massilia sp.]